MKWNITIYLIVFVTGYADWIAITGTSAVPVKPSKIVIESDTLGLILSTTADGFVQSDTTINSNDFQRIHIPGEQVFQASDDSTYIGRPQIPYITLLIALPDSVDFDITVTPSGQQVFDDYLMYPVPNIVFTDDSGAIGMTEEYAYDTLFYQKDTLYPDQFFTTVKDGHWRGQRVAEIRVFPIRYNPDARRMYFYHSLNIRIEYDGSVFENELGLGPFERIGREILLNYPGVILDTTTRSEPAVHYYDQLKDKNLTDYLIVTSQAIVNNKTVEALIDTFARWRVDHNSFDVGIVLIDSVYSQFPDSAPDSSAQLREFLVYAYDNWPSSLMPDSHFGYCLFIGDWDEVPTRLYEYTCGQYTWLGADETYFSELSNNGNFIDIMLGRWPVKSTIPQQTITIINKTLDYEQEPDTSAWRRDGLLIAGNGSEFDPYIATAKPCFSNIGYDTLTVRQSRLTGEQFNDSVQHYLNNGEIIAAYYDHGAPQGWKNYDTIDVKALTNGSKLPVVLSNACLSAMFQWDRSNSTNDPGYIPSTSMAEHFLFNDDGGAVAFFGATAYAFILQNQDMLERLLSYQDWIVGQFTIPGLWGSGLGSRHCYCLLGDPALDPGDFKAYPGLPDLVARPYPAAAFDQIIDTDDPYHGGGATIPIRVKVWNIGQDTARDVDVTISVTLHSDTSFTKDTTISELLPRDSGLVIVHWNTDSTHPNKFGQIGDTIKVTVDPNDEITESWEGNNNAYNPQLIALYPNLDGWPKKLVFSPENPPQPALEKYIINEGGLEETFPVIILPANDSLYVFNYDGTNFNGWPQYAPGAHHVVVGDVNDDSYSEIVAISDQRIFLFDYTGDLTWERTIPSANIYHCSGFPALGDITGSSPDLQVVVFGGKESTANPYPAKVFVFNDDSTLADTFITSDSTYGSINSLGPSISDINDDGYNEIIVSYQYYVPDPLPSRGTRAVTDIFNRDGILPLYSIDDLGNDHMISALADIDSNDVVDFIAGCGNGKVKAYKIDNNDTVQIWSKETNGSVRSSPVIGNIRALYGNEAAFGNDNNKIWAVRARWGDEWSPFPISVNNDVIASPALAKLEGQHDSLVDILIGSEDQWVYALNYSGLYVDSFPLPLYGCPSSIVVGDLDCDGKSENVLTSSDGYLHVWKNLKSWVALWSLEWPQFHHDHQRTGLYGWRP